MPAADPNATDPVQARAVPGREALLRWTGDIAKASAIGVLIGAVLFALFTAANYFSVGRDPGAARQAIAAAFAAGSLGDEDWLRGDTQVGQHQFNDCLILQMAIDQRPSAEQLMVSPSWPTFVPAMPACRDLRRLISGEMPQPQIAFYHRYIHGHTMLARYLLPVVPVDGIRALYKLAISGVLALGLGICLVALATRRRSRAALFWLIVFVAFARCFGIEAFGQSLGHGPADLVLLLFVLLIASASLWRGLPEKAVVPLAAAFGAATMIFEFLTGGIPLGLAVLIGGLPFAVRDGDERRDVVRAGIAYGSAIVTCAALKLILIVRIFGTEGLAGIGRQLVVRMGGGSDGEADQGFGRFAIQLLKGLDGMVPGMREFALAILALAIGAGGWGLAVLARSPDRRLRAQALLLAASTLVAPIWLLAFREHSIAHAWFMDRILVWTVASGFGLFALAVTDRGSRTLGGFAS
jgi:hypothetical protein